MTLQLILFVLAADIAAPSAVPAPAREPSVSIVGAGEVSQAQRFEFGTALSQDGDALFIGIDHGGWSSIELYVPDGQRWTHARRVIGSEGFSANDPVLSLDGDRLYFITDVRGSFDIGFVERREHGEWSLPVFAAPPINSRGHEYYTSFTRDGDMVFASDREATQTGDFDIYLSRKRKDGFAEPQPFPAGINTDGYEADAFIAPGGDYLIFSSSREGGHGRGDLYVSFATGSDGWTRPRALGAVNTEGHEICPFVSRDGSTLYFTRDGDIYQADISVVHALRGPR